MTTTAQATAPSQLDFCKSLPATRAWLSSLLNMAVSIVFKKYKSDHATCLLETLQWFPILFKDSLTSLVIFPILLALALGTPAIVKFGFSVCFLNTHILLCLRASGTLVPFCMKCPLLASL